MPSILSALALVPLAFGAAADETARGVVFDDADRDGVRATDERGVPGVAVSNGRDVVVTDRDGRYELAVREHDVVFVTKPAGWAVPTDADELPQFFHVHAPTGTPAELGLRYPGVEPSGPLPASLDFPLHRDPTERERFDAIWIADPQPEDDVELSHVRDAFIAELIGVDAEFGITVGDIMFDDLSLLPRSTALYGTIGVPWYHVPGNHELNFDAPDDRWSTETFKRHFGPTNYSFDVGRAHFVVLDDVDYRGVDEDGNGGYDARLNDEQLGWLAADLALVPTDGLVVVAMHIPLAYPSDDGQTHVTLDGAPRLFEILAPFENLLLVAGHTHTAEHHYFDDDHGFDGDDPLHLHILATVSGSWWSGPLDERGIPTSWCRDGTAKGYYVMEVVGTAVSLRFVPLGMSTDTQIHLSLTTSAPRVTNGEGAPVSPSRLADGRVDAARLSTTELVANVFNGGPRSRVTLTVADREPRPMTRRYVTDPFFDDLYFRHEEEMKGWVKPVPSTHVWVAPLPRDLTPGAHTLRVDAVDEYGAEHSATVVLEVEG